MELDNCLIVARLRETEKLPNVTVNHVLKAVKPSTLKRKTPINIMNAVIPENPNATRTIGDWNIRRNAVIIFGLLLLFPLGDLSELMITGEASVANRCNMISPSELLSKSDILIDCV
mgnify:FL=1